jgi:hypothetical protein
MDVISRWTRTGFKGRNPDTTGVRKTRSQRERDWVGVLDPEDYGKRIDCSDVARWRFALYPTKADGGLVKVDGANHYRMDFLDLDTIYAAHSRCRG